MKTRVRQKCALTGVQRLRLERPRSQKSKKSKDREESEVRKESEKSIEKTANALEIEG
jgi:hypothetical protein